MSDLRLGVLGHGLRGSAARIAHRSGGEVRVTAVSVRVRPRAMAVRTTHAGRSAGGCVRQVQASIGAHGGQRA